MRGARVASSHGFRPLGLLAVVFCLGATPAVDATVHDLLEGVRPWLVALRVKRTADLDVGSNTRGDPLRRAGQEVREYFGRPDAPVAGLLIDPRGWVLTTYYNVGGDLESIEVRLADGTWRSARVLGTSKMDDIALVAVEGDEPVVSDANWKDIPWREGGFRCGQTLFAVGPFDGEAGVTVTQGIVSAVGRNGDRAVQTDAKLNYANVGGPVIDLDGRVIGVSGFVGHIYPQWGLNSGIGFVTTAETLRSIVPALARGEDIEPPPAPFLGVVSDQNEVAVRGARIASVVDGSGAAKSGLQAGDLILEIAGREIINFQQLRHLLYDYKVGDTVKLLIERDGNRMDLDLILGKRPENIR